MPDLLNVEEFTLTSSDPREDDIPGFKLTYEAAGLSASAVTGRLIGRLAAQYPLKANKIEQLSIDPVDDDGITTTFIIELFVPLNGIENNKGVRALQNLWQEL